MSMHVLVTGGSSGFGKNLVKLFGANSTGAGRSTGWNLEKNSEWLRLAEESLNYDVFINFAFIRGSIQLGILTSVFELWKSRRKQGLIVNIGTINTYFKRSSFNHYSVDKAPLDEACYQMAKECASGRVPFRVSNFRVGYLEMDKNVGKNFYPNFGISENQVSEMVSLIYRNPQLVYPEVIIEIKQPDDV